jgi:serine/threonine protein kinase
MVDELIGKHLGGYEILSRIGRGGMATVYLALQTSMNRHVAIKLLPRDQMKDDSYLQRFEREVNIVARLEHRNIVPVYDHGMHDDQPYIVMRYMSAGSIDDLLREGPLPPEKMLSLIEQIASALDYAHTKNVLHRDLKPSNVLLDDDGGAYITDFGIARMLGSEGQGSTITTQGVVGTPSYMSPEQAQGQPLDGRSDVYALGIMLFEMATGRRPFQNETPYSIAVMQVTTPPPPPRSINPKLTTAVEQVIYKTLKKKPDERYQTGAQLAESLKMAIERPADFSGHDTQRPFRKPAASLQATQPNPVQMGNTVPSQPMQYQPPVPMPQQPMPSPTSLYPPPTSSGSLPVRSSTGLRQRIKKKQGGNMWVSIFIGALLGCGMLTIVVILLAMVVNSVMNGSTESIDSTPETGSNPASIDGVTESPQNSVKSEDDATPDATRSTSSLSPLKAQLIFFADRGEDFEIFRHDLNNQDEVQLTSDTSANMFPVGSPDGQRVAFQSDRDGDFDIYTVNPNGGALVKVIKNDVDDVMPSWSPDGAWLAFASDTRADGTLDLFIVRPDGTDLRRVLTNERRNSNPRWSPDGNSLVFTTGAADDASTWEIALLDVATGHMRKLTENDVRDAWAEFSPDGEQIVYITGNEGVTAVARLTVDSAQEPEIVYAGSAGEYMWNPRYSLDGTYILLHLGSLEDPAGRLYVMQADGTNIKYVSLEKGLYASWLP